MKTLVFKLLVALLCSLVALIVPFFLLTPAQSVEWVRYYGYWLIAAAFLAFLWALFFRGPKLNSWKEWFLNHRVAVLVAALISSFYQFHEDRELKILFDEFAINLTGMEMHFHQEAWAPMVAHRVQDFVYPIKGMVDKRPIFFPFLLSIVHTISGYRFENVFVLNAILSFSFLLLLYEFTRQLTSRNYGLFGMLCFSTFPLMAQNATGGGFELLNLVLILALLLCAKQFLESDHWRGLEHVIMVSVLLANTRYESVLYTMIPVVVVVIKWWKERKLEISWFSVITPLFVLLPILCNRVFASNDSFFANRRDDFFGFQYFADNVLAALGYLFDFDGDYTNSIFISAIGVISLIFAAVLAVRLIPRIFREKNDFGLLVYYLGMILVFGITLMLLNFFWGKWTDPLTTRFSLPMHMMMIISFAVIMHQGFGCKKLPNWVLTLPIAFLLVFAGKTFGRSIERTQMYSTTGYRWLIEYADENLDKEKSLFIASSPGIHILKGYAAMPTQAANLLPERLMKMKEIGLYKNIYVCQYIRFDPFSHEAIDRSLRKLSPRFTLEPVAMHRVRINYAFQISEVVGIKPAEDRYWETIDVNLPPELPKDLSDDDQYWAYVYELCKVNDIIRLTDLAESHEFQTFSSENSHSE